MSANETLQHSLVKFYSKQCKEESSKEEEEKEEIAGG
jgi:hypothetical protein